MLFANENSNDGIEKVLQEIQQYVPCYGEGKEKVYSGQGVNYLLQIANGLTPEERKECLHFEISDFHTKMKFLQVKK